MTQKEAIDEAFKSISPRYKLAQLIFTVFVMLFLGVALLLFNLKTLWVILLSAPIGLVSFKLTELFFKFGNVR